MSSLSYPSDLSDLQWQLIESLLPAAKPGGRPRSVDLRAVVNAILYVLVTGCPWRYLPHSYPNWKTVYHYFATWRDDGTWPQVHEQLRAWTRVGVHQRPHRRVWRWPTVSPFLQPPWWQNRWDMTVASRLRAASVTSLWTVWDYCWR